MSIVHPSEKEEECRGKEEGGGFSCYGASFGGGRGPGAGGMGDVLLLTHLLHDVAWLMLMLDPNNIAFLAFVVFVACDAVVECLSNW